MTGRVTTVRSGKTSVWTLDNAGKGNALDFAMLDELSIAAAEIEQDSNIRAVIIVGAGKKAFCTGADIAAWGNLDAVDFARRWIGAGHHLFDRLARLPVPLIAAMNGPAFGGGLELAAVCDLRIASASATFALPEASLGVTPGWSGAQRLARLLPQALLREMALTGGRLSAERLYAVGFLNELSDEPLERAIEIADRVATLAPRAVETTRLVLNAALGEAREAAIDALAGALVCRTQDKAEGVASFGEKRQPKFSGY